VQCCAQPDREASRKNRDVNYVGRRKLFLAASGLALASAAPEARAVQGLTAGRIPGERQAI
jgi:hypothetical protein